MELTENEKKALQLMVDNADEIEEDNGKITYLAVCMCSINENNLKGFRGICSSLVQKNVVAIEKPFYLNIISIPVDGNYRIKFEEI